jgi:stage II sporulation protein D
VRAIAASLFFLTIVLRVLVAEAPAQGETTEPDLESASAGRTVRVGLTATGRISSIPLEVYVARVLAGEGEPRAADAAQQALAIAIRTFALANAGRHGREGFDLCDSTHCQVLRASTAASRRAAMATVGLVLTYEGRVAEVFYSASCGGRSEAAADVWPGSSYPYLRSVPDDVCEGDTPWSLDLSATDVRRALERIGFEGSGLRDVGVDRRSGSGRVVQLHLTGLRPDVITGEQFRAAIGAAELRSTAFTVSREGGRFRFTGRGYGHGVGMCVIGAGRRASRGESAQAILEQYFPALELTRLDPLGAKAPISLTTSASPPPLGTRSTDVVVRVPESSSVTAASIAEYARRAHSELSKTLGASVIPVTIQLHDSLDSFRTTTGRPWWVTTAAQGTTIDLAPTAVLVQRDGVEAAVRLGVAELLVSGPLATRPAWVRVGAARYFASGRSQTSPSAETRCPADAELTLAISAPAQREAEVRAESCFARALARVKDWRAVH